MKTYTIVATDAREKIDNTYLSLQLYLIPEADIEISRDGGATSAVLKAGVGIGLNLLSPTLRVKGTEAKTISIYNGAFAVKFEGARFGGTANYTEFEDDGTLKFIGDAIVYNDIIISPANLRVGTTAPDFAVFQDTIYQLKFINGQTDTVYGSFEIPHGYKEGSNLELHIHRSPSTTNTGNCVFNFNYTIANMGTGVFGTAAQKTLTQAGSGVVNKHQYMSGNTVIDGENIKIGDIIVFELSRPTGDAFTGDAFLHSVGLHYQQDTIGSRNVTSK